MTVMTIRFYIPSDARCNMERDKDMPIFSISLSFFFEREYIALKIVTMFIIIELIKKYTFIILLSDYDFCIETREKLCFCLCGKKTIIFYYIILRNFVRICELYNFLCNFLCKIICLRF